MNLLEFIPFGSKNAIKRADLVMASGMSDREMRRCIEELRKETPIVNMQNGQGYFRPETEEELNHYIAQEKARATTILKNLRAAEKQLQIVRGQLTMSDI